MRIIYLSSEIKGFDQLHGYRTADLCLHLAYAKSRFSHDAAQEVSSSLNTLFKTDKGFLIRTNI